MAAGGAAGAAAGAAIAIANAIKASGAIVRIEPDQFRRILDKVEEPLVVTGRGGFFRRKNQYLTSYKGIYFYTTSVDPISLSARAEVVSVSNIWIPG